MRSGKSVPRAAALRAWLQQRDDESAHEDGELALAQSHTASSGADGAEAHRPDDAPRERFVRLPTRRKARIDNFDLDAEVAVHEHERERLEYLCRYILRPPIALDRLERLVCRTAVARGATHASSSGTSTPR